MIGRRPPTCHCERHLPVVTYGFGRFLRRRRAYFLRCWDCDMRWGPLTHGQAFKMCRMVDAVNWRTGHS